MGGYQNVVCKQSIVTAVFVSTIVIVTVNSSHGARTPLEQSLLLLSFLKLLFLLSLSLLSLQWHRYYYFYDQHSDDSNNDD